MQFGIIVRLDESSSSDMSSVPPHAASTIVERTEIRMVVIMTWLPPRHVPRERSLDFYSRSPRSDSQPTNGTSGPRQYRTPLDESQAARRSLATLRMVPGSNRV